MAYCLFWRSHLSFNGSCLLFFFLFLFHLFGQHSNRLWHIVELARLQTAHSDPTKVGRHTALPFVIFMFLTPNAMSPILFFIWTCFLGWPAFQMSTFSAKRPPDDFFKIQFFEELGNIFPLQFLSAIVTLYISISFRRVGIPFKKTLSSSELTIDCSQGTGTSSSFSRARQSQAFEGFYSLPRT